VKLTGIFINKKKKKKRVPGGRTSSVAMDKIIIIIMDGWIGVHVAMDKMDGTALH